MRPNSFCVIRLHSLTVGIDKDAIPKIDSVHKVAAALEPDCDRTTLGSDLFHRAPNYKQLPKYLVVKAAKRQKMDLMEHMSQKNTS